MPGYTFIFEKEELLRYKVEEDGRIFRERRFSLADAGAIGSLLFEDAEGDLLFDVFLSRHIAYEYECEIPSSAFGPEEVEKKLLQNPLYDRSRHLFVFIPSEVKEKKDGTQLVNVFYFEKKWIDIIEALFIKRGRVPQRAGILSSLYRDDYLFKSGNPFLYLEWGKSLEINLIKGEELLYSRHVPLRDEQAEDIFQEVKSSVEHLKDHVPDMEKSVYVMAPAHHRESLRKAMEKADAGFSLSWLSGEAAAGSVKDDIWSDEYVIPVFHSLRFSRALIDIADKIPVSFRGNISHFRWVKAASAAFFVIGLIGFLSMNVVNRRLQKDLRRSFSGFLTEKTENLTNEEFFLRIEKLFDKRSVSREASTDVFNSMIYCFPRDSEWDLVLFSKQDVLYHIQLVFEEEPDALSFLKAAEKIGKWKIKDSKQVKGSVDLYFETQGEKDGS